MDGVRQWHYLKPDRPAKWPQRVLVVCVDREGQEALTDAACGNIAAAAWSTQLLVLTRGMYEKAEKASGAECEKLWEYVDRVSIPRRNLFCIGWCIAWGIASTGLWDLVDGGDWAVCGGDPTQDKEKPTGASRSQSGICVLEDPPTILGVKRCGRSATVRLLDSRNFGLETRPVPAEGQEQVEADSSLICRCLNSLISAGVGGLKSTSAAIAWNWFTRSFLKSPVLIHGDPSVLELEQEGLYSGRCECFHLGRVCGPVIELDVQSHYLSLGNRIPIPTRLRGSDLVGLPVLRQAIAAGYFCCARVAIDTPEPCYPKRVVFGTIFPVGRFWTVIAGAELERALERGHCVACSAGAKYETDRLFDRWSSDLLALVSANSDGGSKPIRGLWKRIGISLFGRFAAQAFHWETTTKVKALERFGIWWGLNPETGEPTRFRAIGGVVQYECRDGARLESSPIVFAAITAAGRMQLWELLEIAGRAEVYYCDTDSIHLSLSGADKLKMAGLVQEGRNGSLAEKNRCVEASFAGIKHYRAGDKICAAGVPKHASWTGSDSAEWLTSQPLMDALRERHGPDARKMVRQWKKRGTYLHGRVQADGRVLPHELKEF
jgi:hypothetical protein